MLANPISNVFWLWAEREDGHKRKNKRAALACFMNFLLWDIHRLSPSRFADRLPHSLLQSVGPGHYRCGVLYIAYTSVCTMKLDSKVAIVTGSARGLGWEIVQAFVQEGAKVVICDLAIAEVNQAA